MQFFDNKAEENSRNLAVFKAEEIDFNNKIDSRHRQLINSCITDFKNKYKAMQHVDQKIAAGLLGTIAGAGILFLNPYAGLSVMVASLAVTGYEIGARAKIKSDYQLAAQNLIECCKFIYRNRNKIHELVNNEIVLRLNQSLAQVVCSKDITEVFNNDCEDYMTWLKTSQNQDISTLTENWDSEQKNFSSHLYGFKKGYAVSAMVGLFYFICNTIKNLIPRKNAEEVENEADGAAAEYNPP